MRFIPLTNTTGSKINPMFVAPPESGFHWNQKALDTASLGGHFLSPVISVDSQKTSG